MRARSRWRLPESGKRSPLVRTEESRSPAGSAGEPSLSMQLRNPEEMAAYLDAWLAEAPDDASGIARALGDIARAKGMTQVARDAGLQPGESVQGSLRAPAARQAGAP